MAILPPFLIVLDNSALLAGETRQWQEITRLGECFVPEAGLEAIQMLCDRASEPEIESKAREFMRFFETSGWQTTNAIAEHPSLQPAAGHALSQRARLALEVLQNAYGLAHRRSESLVILVANDQPLLQRLLGLNRSNLCGIPLTALVQWSRTQRRPATVNHHLQLMRSTTPVTSEVTQSQEASGPHSLPLKQNTSRQTAARQISAHQRSASSPSASAPARSLAPRPSTRASSSPHRIRRSFRFSSFLANLITLAVLALVGGALWRFIHPASFNQFWQQLPFVAR
ncbi:MAG: hypothetical protein OHK0047_43210 [Leptolyngbyaceae cyanobacterium]